MARQLIEDASALRMPVINHIKPWGFLALIVSGLVGCEVEDDMIQHSLRIDLRNCLGAIESPNSEPSDGDNIAETTGCDRNLVNAIVHEGEESNGCFVLEFGSQDRQYIPVHWKDGRLSLHGSPNTSYAPGEAVMAGLFLFSTSRSLKIHVRHSPPPRPARDPAC